MRNPLRALFERKSIGSPYELSQVFMKGFQSLSGASVNESTALSVAAVMTCVSIRSRALASLPVKVFERIDERNKQPAGDHPLARVLSQPNSWQTWAEFSGMVETHRLLRGNGLAWINRGTVPGSPDRPQVLELLPLHPDRVEIVESANNFGGAPLYRLQRKNGGERIDLQATEVLHVKGMSTNGWKGRSVLEDARELIGSAITTQEHSSSFWSNDATPSIALRHPGALSPVAKKNIEDSWETTYGQGKDRKRVAVLEEAMEIEQLSVTAKDAQFLETRQFTRSEIAGLFHVPPHMIGDTEKSTSWGTGIEQQQIGFVTFTLTPDLVIWQQRLTRDLVVNPSRFFIEFSPNGLMRGDAAARSNFYWRMVQMGAMSPNDVRALENMNPTPNGDVYLQPVNMAPLGSDPLASTGGGTQ